MPKSHKIVYMIYVIIWVITAIHPRFPQDWFLENILVFFIFPFIMWLDAKYRFSLLSLIFLLIFGSMHALGAHFTYAKMEYFDVVTAFFNLERNQYDRVVHFVFGLLLFRPIFEIVISYTKTIKAALLFTFAVVIMISTLYEILEWFAAITFHPELGIAFIASQGDVWDSQKDILAAITGALVNIIFFRHIYLDLLEE